MKFFGRSKDLATEVVGGESSEPDNVMEKHSQPTVVDDNSLEGVPSQNV
jgi:hypothetical protein